MSLIELEEARIFTLSQIKASDIMSVEYGRLIASLHSINIKIREYNEQVNNLLRPVKECPKCNFSTRGVAPSEDRCFLCGFNW